MIFVYKKNTKNINQLKNENKIIKMNKNIYKNLKSGDILQSSFFWNNDYAWLLNIIPIDYLHNIIIINYKNKKYGLHYVNKKFGYPKNILSFNNKHIEIFDLQEYFYDNYYSSKYYRLVQVKEDINNDDIFIAINKLNDKNIKFTFLPSIKRTNNTDYKYYNCVSFILKILNESSIIPNMNFRNFFPNEFIYLPHISNYYYNNLVMIEV